MNVGRETYFADCLAELSHTLASLEMAQFAFLSAWIVMAAINEEFYGPGEVAQPVLRFFEGFGGRAERSCSVTWPAG